MSHFERGAVMRAPAAEVRAGGKGIDFKTSNYKGNIRVATMYHEANSPVTTIVNEEGATIVQSEWDDFLAELQREIKPGKTVFVPQVHIEVSSTVGTGDSLAAGFILKTEEHGSISDLDSIDWKLSLQCGSATAAAACEI